MIKFCVEKWNKNHKLLEAALKSRTDLNTCGYRTLVEMAVTYIFNDGLDCDRYDYCGKLFRPDLITEIDNGDYQGTLIYLIPNATYQPGPGDYLMTYVYYGSCSVCDTLQAIQDYIEGPLTDEQISDFMSLCKNLVQYTIKPYNSGWRNDEQFDVVEVEI